MAIVFDTTETSGWRRTVVADTSPSATIVADKPTAVAEGDLMVAVIHNNAALNPGTIIHPSGWTQAVTNANLNGNFRMHTTYAWKVAGASEPSAYTWTIGASVADDSVTIIRATGVDAATPVDAVGAENSASATSFTGLSITTATDGAVILWSVGARDGNVLTAVDSGYPAGTTGIFSRATRASSNGVNSGFALQAVATAGASGAAAWNSYLTTAKYGTAIGVAFRPSAATGPTVSFITNPASDSMTITLSEAAATVDTISITYGGVTQSQSYTTGDNTTFTIASLTRNLLPPTGTTTVTLLAGVTEITSTTTVLDDIPGWETTDLVSPVTTEGSVFYNHTGATPVTGDKVRHNDPGNTTISATGILTQTTPRTVTVEAWDDSDETYGSLGAFTYSAETGQLVRVLQATALESTGMAATSLIATML